MNFDILHPADQLVMTMNRIYYRGMTTTSGGNLSIRDGDESVWITPSGVDKGNLRRDDIMRILPDGEIFGPHRPSVEYPFHLSVYKERSDLGAVLHAHSPGLVAVSLIRRLPDVFLTAHSQHVCGNLSIAPYALPGSRKLGENIGREFGKGYDIVLLENHGVVIGAYDMAQAFKVFETLETAARLEIMARRLGGLRSLTEADVQKSTVVRWVELPSLGETAPTSEEKALRRDIVKFIHRSYDLGLFTSTQGTYSARLSEGSFLITPYGRDRKYLEEEDLVLMKEGRCEEGKVASRAALLHEEIYRQHPEVNSVLIAQPLHLMAFAVTDAHFDARTIPESYILLRDTRKIPFGVLSSSVEEVAGLITDNVPVLICANECVIVTGKSLLAAFDRLEVAEFSAKSIIESKALGEIVRISDRDVEDISEAFGLS